MDVHLNCMSGQKTQNTFSTSLQCTFPQDLFLWKYCTKSSEIQTPNRYLYCTEIQGSVTSRAWGFPWLTTPHPGGGGCSIVKDGELGQGWLHWIGTHQISGKSTGIFMYLQHFQNQNFVKCVCIAEMCCMFFFLFVFFFFFTLPRHTLWTISYLLIWLTEVNYPVLELAFVNYLAAGKCSALLTVTSLPWNQYGPLAKHSLCTTEVIPPNTAKWQ